MGRAPRKSSVASSEKKAPEHGLTAALNFEDAFSGY
jgi:hypothetical protein